MELAPRHGHGRALYQRRARHVQLRIKAMNARIVDNAGIGTQKILLMENTNKIQPCAKNAFERPLTKVSAHVDQEGYAALGSLPAQSPHKILLDVRQIVARQYALLTEAPSNKLQAPSSKLQATSNKLQAATYCRATICRIDTRCSCDVMSH